MKGVVFTEFLEMVEEQFSPEVADRIITASDLPSHGAYTAVGTYDHNEMIRLVSNLSARTGIAVPDLLRAYGKRLFGRFYLTHPQFFETASSAFDFLKNIEKHVHAEVRKLYSDAELPSFDCTTPHPDTLVMVYRSSRPLADFAEGLILGCVEHFREPIDVQREDLPDAHGTAARFSLRRRSQA